MGTSQATASETQELEFVHKEQSQRVRVHPDTPIYQAASSVARQLGIRDGRFFLRSLVDYDEVVDSRKTVGQTVSEKGVSVFALAPEGDNG